MTEDYHENLMMDKRKKATLNVKKLATRGSDEQVLEFLLKPHGTVWQSSLVRNRKFSPTLLKTFLKNPKLVKNFQDSLVTNKHLNKKQLIDIIGDSADLLFEAFDSHTLKKSRSKIFS